MFVRKLPDEPRLPRLRGARAGDRRPAPARLLAGADRGTPRLAGVRGHRPRRSSTGSRPIRFEGDVWAVPEGTVVFPGEPLIRVEAPLPRRSGSRRSCWRRSAIRRWWPRRPRRIVEAAAGRPVYDFGARRGHGPHAGLIAARRGVPRRLRGDQPRRGGAPAGHPCVGHDGPFVGPVVRRPSSSVRGVRPGLPRVRRRCWSTRTTRSKACATPRRSSPRSRRSGSTAATSATWPARRGAILDDHGRRDVRILASGDLDEWSIARLVAVGRADRRLRRGHRDGHQPRRPGAGDRLQAR